MKSLVVVLALMLIGCTRGDSEISAQLSQCFSNVSITVIDLAELGPSTWERVCVLTPYSTNAQAEAVLGFKWDAEGKTDIASNDGINVLVFARGKELLAYVEHPRGQGDLLGVQPQCLQRAQAKVLRRVGADGWVYLVAQNAV